MVLSSAKMLLRVGPATYSKELVRAFTRVRKAYAGSIRAVHGFPIPLQGLHSEVLISSLLDIEHWLTEIDKKAHQLSPCFLCLLHCQLAQDHSTEEYASYMQRANSTYGTAANIPYSMPHYFFSLDKGVFTSPGWEDVATHLPTLKEEDKKNFLVIMLEELNNSSWTSVLPRTSLVRWRLTCMIKPTCSTWFLPAAATPVHPTDED